MRSVLSSVRRFLFWTLLLVVVGYVCWGRVEAWRLSRVIADIQARGEPVDYGYWYARQVTAEQREAASLYARAADFATEAESGQQYRAWQIDVDVASGPVLTLADITASYRPDAPAMQLLDRATPMDFTEFGEDNRELFDNQVPLQALGAQACLRADVAAARGDADGAVAALVPCIRLQRTFLSIYSSQHATRLLGSFRVLLRHASPSDASLAALQQAVASWTEEDRAVRALLQQRVRYLSYADAPRRGFGEFVTSALAQPFLTNLTRRRVESFDAAIAIARLPPDQRREALAAERRAPRPRRRGLFGQFLEPQVFFGSIYNTGSQDLAARRAIVSVLAVERYRRAHRGTPPQSLNELVPALLPAVPEDPYLPGQPIVYRQDAGGYVVYSVDTNRKDDGGEFYGHGAAVKKHVGPQSPRDLGIRVPLTSRTALNVLRN